MSEIKITPVEKIKGTIVVGGDKSISHRAVMISSLARGMTKIKGLCLGEDVVHAIVAFRNMGVKIKIKSKTKGEVVIGGKGLRGLIAPKKTLYLGNSGTAIRLLLGILAPQEFKSKLTGDKSLSKRPMKRVTRPLCLMGADIKGKDHANFAPLEIKGSHLKGINYRLKVASAQVKSAILFAGLYASGITSVTETVKSRDHTERMLRYFGASLKVTGLRVSINAQKKELSSKGNILIPGDISNAAFFIIAALIVKESCLKLKAIGLNPTRLGIIDILKRMGADIETSNIKNQKSKLKEPVGDITVKSSKLIATTIKSKEVPRTLDELPIIMVAASFASGVTRIKGAGELRVKETDRIHSMVTNLTKLGAKIKVDSKGDIVINGASKLKGAEVNSFSDHRTAMSMIIAGLAAEGETIVKNISCINTSFPDFLAILQKII